MKFFNAMVLFFCMTKKKPQHLNITFCICYHQTVSENPAKTMNSTLKLKLIGLRSKLAPKQWQKKVFLIRMSRCPEKDLFFL